MSKSALNAQYNNAKQRLSEAEAKVIEASADRLIDIMRKPRAEQWSAVEDPDLTASDRHKLREALASGMRSSNAKSLKWRIIRICRGFTNALAANLVSATLAILLYLPPCVALLLIWRNTASLIIVPSNMVVEWRLPSGQVRSSSIQAGQKIVMIRDLSGSLAIRTWLPANGYAIANVTVE